MERLNGKIQQTWGDDYAEQEQQEMIEAKRRVRNGLSQAKESCWELPKAE